jgi:hypothetical protein
MKSLQLRLIVIRFAVGIALIPVAALVFAMIPGGMAVGILLGEHRHHGGTEQMFMYALGGFALQIVAIGLIFAVCGLISVCFYFPGRNSYTISSSNWAPIR